jgi:hypothetical protein
MQFDRVFVSGTLSEFKHILLDRLLALAKEAGSEDVVLPVGLFLILDEATGGDSIAKEIARRFGFLDFESRNVIDFYYLGWRRISGKDSEIEFDLDSFELYRTALRRVGVTAFGGNADLILVDARLTGGQPSLDFEHVIHIDLSTAIASRNILGLGAFLQGLIQTAEEIKTTHNNSNRVVYGISNKLGLAIAKTSILDFVLKKWGSIIGASALAPLAIKNVGPVVDLSIL